MLRRNIKFKSAKISDYNTQGFVLELNWSDDTYTKLQTTSLKMGKHYTYKNRKQPTYHTSLNNTLRVTLIT